MRNSGQALLGDSISMKGQCRLGGVLLLALLAVAVAAVTVTLHEAAHLAVAYSLLLGAVQLQEARASAPDPSWASLRWPC